MTSLTVRLLAPGRLVPPASVLALGAAVAGGHAAEPAAAPPTLEAAAPIQAVVQDFGRTKVLAYYTREAGRCALVVMTGEEPGPRVRVSLAPAQTAAVEDVGGGALGLTCGAEAARLLVERRPRPEASAGR
jgi:hypothetical protein